MTRIATLATSEQLLSMMGRTQARVHDLQTQVATGKRAQTYAGIPGDARRLLDLETSKQVVDRFEQNNALMKTRLEVTSTSVDGLSETIRGFRQDLVSFVTGSTPLTAEQASDLQEAAFRAMKSIEDRLNTEVDGRYLFAGSRVRTQPVQLPYESLQQFQNMYDGNTTVYPTTEQSHVGRRGDLAPAVTGGLIITGTTITATTPGAFSGIAVGTTITLAGAEDPANNKSLTVYAVSGDTLTVANPAPLTTNTSDAAATINGTLTPAVTGGLTITPTTITATTPGAFSALTVGSTITISGAEDSGNNKDVTITAISGDTLTVANPAPLTANADDDAAAVTIENWFHGDKQTQTHRMDEERSFTSDLTAVHPAFEKAMRALGILAQGTIGTPGGLDAHDERVDQALFLLNDAIEPGAAGTPPFGTEAAGNLDEMAETIGFQQVMLDESSMLHQHLAALLVDRIAGLENADTTQAIAQLLEGTSALEASYQTIARVRQLSLAQFL